MNPIYAGLLLGALLGLLWLAYWLGARDAREDAEKEFVERFNRRMKSIVTGSLLQKEWLAQNLEHLSALPKHARIRAGVKRVAEELREEIAEAQAEIAPSASADGGGCLGACKESGCEG